MSADKIWTKTRYRLIAIGLPVACMIIVVVTTLAHRGPRGRVAYALNSTGIYVMNLNTGNAERLTGDCITVARSPAWSPDGKSVAFACSIGGTYNLCITDTEEMQAWKCSDYEGFLHPGQVPERCAETIHSISWSSDAQRLAFTCSDQDGETFVCITTMDSTVDCWPASTIARYESVRDDAASVDWSPAQDRLAVSMELPYFGDSIFLTDPDGRNSYFLVQGRDPSWSPDGKQIAFLRDSDGMYLIDPDGYESHSICTYPRHGGQESDRTLPGFTSKPAWSPNGRFIAFSGTRNTSGGYRSIFMIDLGTGAIQKITDVDIGEVDDLDWSP